jgi:hypothetical protein
MSVQELEQQILPVPQEPESGTAEITQTPEMQTSFVQGLVSLQSSLE